MDAQDFRSLQEAYLEVYQELDEAEGSYGSTPKATKAYAALATKRKKTPASSFPKGKKGEMVKTAQRHRDRSAVKPQSTTRRVGMTQTSRDISRLDKENETDYRSDFLYSMGHRASGPGGKPKGKKAERQKKTGVSAESYDIYDIILSHLLDEGYAETPEAAEAIMVNMSEEWRDSIIG
jgi:hypothetical protein